MDLTKKKIILTNRVVGKNLFDKNRATLGKYLAITTGVYGNDINSVVSDFIPVKPSTNYTANANIVYGGSGIAFYDSNKALLSCTNKGGAQIIAFTTDANTKFFRVGLDISAVPIGQCTIELGSVATAYEPYKGFSSSM